MDDPTTDELRVELQQRAAAGELLPPCQLHYHLTERLEERMTRLEGILTGNGAVGLDETVRNTHRDHQRTRIWIYAIAAYVVMADPLAISNFVTFIIERLH